MPLSCSCSGYDAEWWYFPPEDYSAMPLRSRRCRCSSCRKLIDTGATVAAFRRSREPCSDVEESIYGVGENAVTLATWFLCEPCADLYFSLFELGFECVGPDESMRELVREYAARAAGRRAARESCRCDAAWHNPGTVVGGGLRGFLLTHCRPCCFWSWRSESNRRPADYKSGPPGVEPTESTA